MGDSEVVARSSTSYPSIGHSDIGSVAGTDPHAPSVGVVEDLATIAASVATGDLNTTTAAIDASGTVPYGSTLAGDALTTDHGFSKLEAFPATYDSGENLANSFTESSQIHVQHVSANSNYLSEASNFASGGVNENAITSVDIHESAPVHQLLDASALSAEEERLWSIVRANSLDFSAWTALIDETEKMAEDNILKIRRVYDAFLAEFPLCYGYWKKYADHEAHLGAMDKVVEVYERAVQGVTYSVDMWLHYCVFSIGTYGDPDSIRRLFERGLAYVGIDYLSFPLWDKYVEYEYTQQDWSRVAMIYTRILENPNQQLDRYFEGFKELVAHRPLTELMTAEEAAASAAAASSETGGQEIEGEVQRDAAEQTSKPVSLSLKAAEELEKYIAIREELYKKVKEFDSKIIGFETAITRPYFHVRPLMAAELENWHNYLDFMEAGYDFNKHLLKRGKEGPSSLFEGPPCFINGVVKLYERCLIACANYPEFWMRYVLCMEASGSKVLADNALARATQVYVKRQPEIHLFAARFKEHHSDITGARGSYQLVHTEISPGLVEAIIKHSNMEHRQGNLEGACSLYEQAIAIEKGKEHSQTLPLLFAQYSRFVYMVSGKVEKAREILDQALENLPLSRPLLEALIHFESIQSPPKRIDYIESLVEKFIVPSSDNTNVACITEREELSSIFLEFLDLFGNVESIKKADNRHSKLFLQHKSTSESKKRHAEDILGSDRTKLARSAVASSALSVIGAYPNAQNQMSASYGVQPQVWSQATQAQGQQWNPAYSQQGTYGAYGSYGSSYIHPQVPTSATQTAAYGAYPPTYSAQAFSQQSFAQSATAATLIPPQQPASVPTQAYYGSY